MYNVENINMLIYAKYVATDMQGNIHIQNEPMYATYMQYIRQRNKTLYTYYME
jgi:hypothetical protein